MYIETYFRKKEKESVCILLFAPVISYAICPTTEYLLEKTKIMNQVCPHRLSQSILEHVDREV